jgi:penicillin-binding protein 2
MRLERILKRVRNTKKLVLFIFLLFLLAFIRVQVFHHSYYQELSLKNITKRVETFAPRGIILDRNNRIIVENRNVLSLSLKREFMDRRNEVLERIEKLISFDKNFINKEIQRKAGLPHFIPILLKKGISFEELSIIEARKADFPEISIIAEPVRYYPYEGVASHVLGYVGSLSRDDAFIYNDLNPSSTIGKTGLEKFYDSILRGENGWIEYFVDSKGKILKRKGFKPFKTGNSLKLTLDISLQTFVEEQLKGEKGAVVVVDPRDGGILALASSPSFTLSLFTPFLLYENWISLSLNPDKPLINRAIQGLYSPGSIFKIVLALAGLQEGVIKPEDAINCPGYINVGNQVYRCWKGGGHGHVNLYRAVVESCNVYFYTLGRKLGAERIKKYAKILGLDELTGIDLPEEMKGVIPDPDWKKETRKESWYEGDTVILSIGQGYIILTPIQVASLITTVANDGVRKIPHLLNGFYDQNGNFHGIDWSVKEKETGIKKEFFEIVKRCMWGVVNDGGTGRASMIQGIDVCGKTGTVEVVSRGRAYIKPHAWFAGFAPLKNPEIVVVVILENAGKGGERAAPIARNIFLYYFGKPVPSTKETDVKTVE